MHLSCPFILAGRCLDIRALPHRLASVPVWLAARAVAAAPPAQPTAARGLELSQPEVREQGHLDMNRSLHISSSCRQHALSVPSRAAAPTMLHQLGRRSSFGQQPSSSIQQPLLGYIQPCHGGLHSIFRAKSSSAGVLAPAAVPAVAEVTTSSSFLQALSAEQRDAVLAQEQHIRVIAGPGSGKTRVVAARVGRMLQQGESPSSMLVITFTRKAAGELEERLSADTGSMPYGLTACTFHSLCVSLLRMFPRQAGLKRDWAVASEDDCASIVATLLEGKKEELEEEEEGEDEEDTRQQQGLVRSSRATSRNSSRSNSRSATSSRSSMVSTSKEEEKNKEQTAAWFCQQISAMKNFVESTHRFGRFRSGADIIAELQQADAGRFRNLSADTASKLASMFNRYQRELRWQNLLDFDDLLHHSLMLVHKHPEVRQKLHQRWKHVLVDEGQDTNLCQFELVRQITGPSSKLFMVGDPDQAIYGFRGAQARLLQDLFKQVYAGTAATYYLSDNYRSRPPIITVADSIRKQLRRKDLQIVPGRSMREEAGVHVELVAAPTEQEELENIGEQLQKWHRQGYSWADMAVLCRSKRPLGEAYRAALRHGVPAHLQTGDFWDSIEVKTALALLRAVVYPAAASEGIKRRIVRANQEVRMPITAGFGETSLKVLDTIVFEANLARECSSKDSSSSSSSDSSSSSGGNGSSAATGVDSEAPTSLSACLLAGCGLGSLSQQEAAELWQQWNSALGSQPNSSRLEALQHLAPEWRLPAGMKMKKLNKKQQAGVDRLRGLVQLATAAATVGQPVKDIVWLLLNYSGMTDELTKHTKGTDKVKARKAGNRLKNLETLVEMAGLDDFEDAAPMLFDPESTVDSDSYNDFDSDVGAVVDSSSSSTQLLDGAIQDAASGSSGSSDSIAVLRAFMDYCGLQGENDGQQGRARDPRVSFMTMHASKGKEYKCVVAMSFFEGVLPSYRADTPDELEQERNTAYVAVTRAKDQLLVTWPKVVGRGWKEERTQVSRFLQDAVRLSGNDMLPGVKFKHC